ncbi:ATP-binding cassette domain-containing protein [Nonomuraea roseola]|uniref:ATP-binding cassette domain-containing protein n=1 Tax=Nonomuraea roseola TaxID=46179 RepID=A0ABV5PRI8_9ACTN
MIVAKDLSVEGVFDEVTLETAENTLTVVAGATGSGRTSLLLTLSGRMKPTRGTLEVAGHSRPRAIRKVAALALVDGVTDLDRALTVKEHLHERRRRGRHAEALEGAGLDVDQRTLVRELDREQQVRLGVALALLDSPALIVADNIDAGLPPERRLALWELLEELPTAVVASCVTPPARYDHLVEL